MFVIIQIVTNDFVAFFYTLCMAEKPCAFGKLLQNPDKSGRGKTGNSGVLLAVPEGRKNSAHNYSLFICELNFVAKP